VTVNAKATESAQAFWALLLPHGLEGGALEHIKGGDGEDVDMEPEEGWKSEHMQWWFDFLNRKKVKGISKDTWGMVCPQLSFPGRCSSELHVFSFPVLRLCSVNQLYLHELQHGRFVT